jgi:hypothetical protein
MEINTVQLRQRITSQYQRDIESIDRMESLAHEPLAAALHLAVGPSGELGTGRPRPGLVMAPMPQPASAPVRIKLKDQPQSNNHRGMHNAREACIRLTQPFRAGDLARESGLTVNGASTQLCRWLEKKLLVRVGPGLYKRVGDWASSKIAPPERNHLDVGPPSRHLAVGPPGAPASGDHAAKASNAKGVAEDYLGACQRISETEFGAEELSKASGRPVKHAGIALCSLCKSGKIIRVGAGRYRLKGQKPPSTKPVPASAARLSIPGLDERPDYDNMSLEDLREHLEKAMKDKQEADDAGRAALYRILSDKVNILQGKYNARLSKQ